MFILVPGTGLIVNFQGNGASNHSCFSGSEPVVNIFTIVVK
jgi:hypothetical protein